MLCCKSVKYDLSKNDDRCRGLESEVLRRVLEHKVEKGAERWKMGASYFEGYTNNMSIKSKRMRWLGMSE